MTEPEPTSYERALEELPNVHDANARAIVLALLALTEETMLSSDALRELSKTSSRAARKMKP